MLIIATDQLSAFPWCGNFWLSSFLRNSIQRTTSQQTNKQKGCLKRAWGAKDQLLINKVVFYCRRRHINLAIAWTDYKKAYDMVPHRLILKRLEMVGAAENIVTLTGNSMAQWNTVLTSFGIKLGDISIKEGIFQGDSLSPILFVVSISLSILRRNMKAEYIFKKNTTPINQ